MKIAITGAAGSLGRRLVWHCAREEKAERVVAVIRSEYALSQHHDLFKKLLSPQEFNRIHWMQGDVRDLPRLKKAFHGCESVVHAAALKRIDSILENSTELVQTNILGVTNCLEAAMSENIKKFIFVSSDKGVNPENAYGASKMMGEQLVQSFNSYSAPRGMECLSVRYGNVLGSRGSVYWIWRQELEKEYPIIKLTHPNMTRYFMSFQMAIDTIMAAIYQGRAGHTFIPLCQSYYVSDFLEEMLLLFTKQSSGTFRDVCVDKSGLRKGGEKLDESLCSSRELDEPFRVVKRGTHLYLALNSCDETYILSMGGRKDFEPLLSSNVEEHPTNRLPQEELRRRLLDFTYCDHVLSQFDRMNCTNQPQVTETADDDIKLGMTSND
jgi:UDP-N-acetylglucosamine 4,6-dehydratase